VVRRARARLGPGACVIGVGGIHGTESALAMLRAGADLIQLYTSFVYEGPFLPRTLARGLGRQMDIEGAKALRDLVTTTSPPVKNGANGTNGARNGAAVHS
jgi:dihydroorotate dehydrogenase